ncbi:MAG: hypothetical protein SPH34_03555 [Lachnospiraceae bacterium]|uniref:hypothetical protein n=1 Tax=Galactobacillus timonensis TaxID=2041840 RepID=UPI0023F494E4|nr:hypothetical protein [Galactobacillus timonensis]MCI6753518.1 hypothetical protein [Galactobacillus timonensis]MDD7087288.1 hypothetical protein [Galactobacillus timonensis]MDY5222377.1 hypothetical protein [Lachnospiraceae bacterium]
MYKGFKITAGVLFMVQSALYLIVVILSFGTYAFLPVNILRFPDLLTAFALLIFGIVLLRTEKRKTISNFLLVMAVLTAWYAFAEWAVYSPLLCILYLFNSAGYVLLSLLVRRRRLQHLWPVAPFLFLNQLYDVLTTGFFGWRNACYSVASICLLLAVVFLAASCEFYWYDRMMR